MTNIFFYCDKGVNRSLLNMLISQLSKFSCHKISAKGVLQDGWQKKCDLFVISGGRDLPYVEKLKQEGCQKIRDYVLSGGRFLGICAGAYFASSFVEFDKGGKLEVLGRRDLRFFNGKAVGPVFGVNTFRYNSEFGVRAPLICYKDENGELLLKVYYNGGCYFDTKIARYNLLAKYLELDKPSIIKCNVGDGKAILSGVHFEYSPLLSKNPVQELVDEEEKRKRLFKSIFDQLGIF